MKHGREQAGFTIVELLIVIVVVAILASISVIAYGGIQERARNSALMSGMDSLEKAFKVYAAQNGQYPKPTDLEGQMAGNPGWYSVSCIQPSSNGWPVRNGLGASQCYTISGTTPSWAGYSSIANEALSSVLSRVPDTSSHVSKSGPITHRGITYQYVHDPSASYPKGAALLMYIVDGNQDCARGVKYTHLAGVTACAVELN